MIGCANVNGIDVGCFFIQHLAEISISPRFGMSVESPGGSFIIDVAESHVVGSKFCERSDVTTAHSSCANTGDLQLLTGSNVSRSAKYVSGNDRETERGSGRCGDESAATGARTLGRRLSWVSHDNSREGGGAAEVRSRQANEGRECEQSMRRIAYVLFGGSLIRKNDADRGLSDDGLLRYFRTVMVCREHRVGSE
jgi:hypothetical protein